MQRNLLKTLPLVNKYETICENTIMLTNVRWRKRRWAPVNPSKKFFVPVKPEQNPEEKAELKIRTPRYKTTMKALTNYFIEHVKSKQKAEIDEKSKVAHKQDMDKIFEINDKWNKETALIREARMKQEEAAADEERLALTLKLETEELQRQELAANMILQEKEMAKTFISEDNLEQELEKALDERHNYNFAIDLEGNQYLETSSGQLQTEEKEGSEKKTKLVHQV